MIPLLLVLAFAGPGELAGSVAAPAAFLPPFLPNGGQWPEPARFARAQGAACAWAVDDGWWLSLHERGGELRRGVALRMRFEGAGARPPIGEGRLPGRYSFLLGSDPARWARDLAGCERLRWREAWPGIDVLARPGPGIFEYDLVLAPGADLARARFSCAGQRSSSLAADGSLLLETELGILRQPPPIAWQERPREDGSLERVPLECSFVRIDEASWGFSAPDLDPTLAAVIDPGLVWSTYLAGGSDQGIEAVGMDALGRVYVAGTTDSFDFPVTPGVFGGSWVGVVDAFVTCLEASGSQIAWSTFLGGSDMEQVRALAVSASGEVTVAGETRSSDFPVTAGAFDTTHNGFLDGFVARLAPQGSALSWSTYLGGGLNDRINALALAPSGEVTVAGTTNGSGFPTVPGSFDTSFNGGQFAGDAFASRLDAAGATLVWSTFLGGSLDDGATAIALEPSGVVTLAGVTTSANFPVTPGVLQTFRSGPVDAFVARLDAAGAQLTWSTYLGGTKQETPSAVAIEPGGEVAVVGSTDSSDFPVTPGALDGTFDGPSDGFLARLAPDASQLASSTFLGGSADDELARVVVDGSGRLVLGGSTTSDDMSTTPGAYDRTWNGDPQNPMKDAWVARLAPGAGSIDYATFLGAADEDHLRGMALDPGGAVVFAGRTLAFNFPTTPGSYQPSFNLTATGQGFVVTLNFLLYPIPYGTAKLNSYGASPTIVFDGFPSVADQDLQLGLQSGMPNQKAVVFHGRSAAVIPFFGGMLLAQPPLVRDRVLQLDLFGYGIGPVGLAPGMVGQTLYFQVWFVDPGDPLKVGLSDAFQVLVYP
jgi:hypothetical protein